MAGLSKAERAGKAAYLASNHYPEVEWKDLTDEQKASWLDGVNEAGEEVPVADCPAATPVVEDSAILKQQSDYIAILEDQLTKCRADLIAAQNSIEDLLEERNPTQPEGAIPPCPPILPEKGDKSPGVAEWRAKHEYLEGLALNRKK